MYISYKVVKAKQIEKRRTRSRPVKQVFFYNTKFDNQLSNIARCFKSIRALFVLYLVRLENK